MRITQGTFSYLPDFTDDEIKAQVRYCLVNGWAISVEYTDDPHPRNVYWEMWGLPMFDLTDPDAVMREINECRASFPRPLHQAERLRPNQGPADDHVELHRAAPQTRARFLLGEDGGEGPPDQVHDSFLRERQAAGQRWQPRTDGIIVRSTASVVGRLLWKGQTWIQ